jgi:hypothetical protein
VGEESESRAAVLGRYRDAEQSHLAELAPQVRGEHVLLVDQSGARRDFLVRECMDGFAQQVDVFTEGEWAHGL